VYVISLTIVAGIVYWLASNAFGLLVAHVVDPSLKRAYREDGSRNRRGYLRSIAAAHALALAGTTAALYATCGYYAENNRPAWPAWAVFGAAFCVLLAPRIVDTVARAIRADRLPV